MHSATFKANNALVMGRLQVIKVCTITAKACPTSRIALAAYPNPWIRLSKSGLKTPSINRIVVRRILLPFPATSISCGAAPSDGRFVASDDHKLSGNVPNWSRIEKDNEIQLSRFHRGYAASQQRKHEDYSKFPSTGSHGTKDLALRRASSSIPRTERLSRNADTGIVSQTKSSRSHYPLHSIFITPGQKHHHRQQHYPPDLALIPKR